MNFHKVDSRHYKRADHKPGRKGSNQYARKPRFSWKLISALILFSLAMTYVAFDRAVASQSTKTFTSPIPKNEIVGQLVEPMVIEGTPTPTKVQEFMKTQAEINEQIATWMRLQEMRNDLVDIRLKGGNQ
jgi:hypothetical protein